MACGLWTVFVARPVHMVFEYDRFRVVHAVDIPPELIEQDQSGVEALRPFRDSNEQMEATMAALQGLSLSARPHLWLLYPQARPQVLQAAKPVLTLTTRFSTQVALINAAVDQTRLPIEALVYLPLISRQAAWTVLLDPVTAEPLVYLPLDSF